MSATSRGSERIESDYYPTPAWCVRRLLESGAIPCSSQKRFLEPCAGEGAIIRSLQTANVLGLECFPGRYIDAVELRGECEPALRALNSADEGGSLRRVHVRTGFSILDYYVNGYDVAITNPPFSIAEEVIRHVLTLADTCAFLVRQGFMASERRAGWLRNDMPDTYELPNRPSFTSKATCACGWSRLVPHRTEVRCGGSCAAELSARYAGLIPPPAPICRVRQATDAADYCWLVWTPERGRKAGKRVILASTPLEERKAA